MYKLLIAAMLLPLVLLTGCIPYDEDKVSQLEESESDVICRREKRTGSLRPVRVCRAAGRSPIDDEQTQRDLRDMRALGDISPQTN